MHMDPFMPELVGSIVAILLAGLLMHELRQPNVIAYLIAGIMLGPSLFGAITDQQVLNRLGQFGVVMLMFFIGMEEELYSILTYSAAARTLNFVLYGLDEFTAITVISDSADEIRKRLISDLGRGVTMFAAEGGMSGAPQKVLYSVITRLEIGTAKRIINEVDKNAFIVVQSVGDVEGGAIGKVPLH